MKKIAEFVIKARWAFFAVVIACAVTAAVFIPKITVNYNMGDYIPADRSSITAISKMEEEFNTQGSARLMIEGVTKDECRSLIAELEKIDGISSVSFNEQEYVIHGASGNALVKIFLEKSNYDPEVAEVVDEIRAYFDSAGLEISMSGEAINSIYLRDELASVMQIIMLIACAVILLILFLSSTSWLEPLVYVLVFGIAILINMGTNALFPSISFVTQAICAIIQLALSLDYSIILMHRFNEEKEKQGDAKKAMISALAVTFSPVSASGLTTIAGLMALTFMQFKLGLDIGLVLSKGIVISLLTVFMFMPALVIVFSSLLEKTKHKSVVKVISDFRRKRAEKKSAVADKTIKSQKLPRKKFSLADFQFKTRVVVPVALVLLIVAGFVLQLNTEYSYSLNVARNSNAQVNVEKTKIEDEFGIQNSLVVLVPKGDYEKEKAVLNYLLNEFEAGGQKIITGGQGIVTTGLYELYDAATLSGSFALPLALVQEVYSAMGAAGGFYTNSSGERYLYDVINFVFTGSIAAGYGEAKQGEIDAQYAQAEPLTVLINVTQAKAMYGINDAVAALMFGGAEQITVLQALGFMSVNKIAEQAGMPAQQALIDAQYAQAEPLAELIDVPYSKTVFFIDDNTAALMFNGAAKITMLQGLKFMSDNQIAKASGEAVQQQINGIYLAAQTARAAFESGNYSRLIFNLNAAQTSDEAFEAIPLLREKIAEFYSDSYIVSESATMFDIMKSFTSDTLKINLISFFAVFFVILLMFKSISVPVLLTTLIQGAIFITMGMNTAFGSPIFFICYLVVMCIQMGATVDYAILMTDRFKEARKNHNKIESIRIAFFAALPTILTSGLILVFSAFIIGIVSSINIISALGFLLAQGCVISLLLITFALPQVLLLCDKFMQKTSLGFKVKEE